MRSETDSYLITFHSLHWPRVSTFRKAPGHSTCSPTSSQGIAPNTVCTSPSWQKCSLCQAQSYMLHWYFFFFLIMKNTFKMSTNTPFCKETSTKSFNDLPNVIQPVSNEAGDAILSCVAPEPILLTNAFSLLLEESTKVTGK